MPKKCYPVKIKTRQIRIVLKNAVHFLPPECVAVGGPAMCFYLDNELRLAVPFESFLFAELVER